MQPETTDPLSKYFKPIKPYKPRFKSVSVKEIQAKAKIKYDSVH